mgnify:CR=1 FL=1
MTRRVMLTICLLLLAAICRTPSSADEQGQLALAGSGEQTAGDTFPDRGKWAQAARIEAWTAWVKKQNSKLTDVEARLIVESVLYYSYKLEIDHRLAFAMIKAESNFDPRCSCGGAVGLTQLMSSTARGLGVENRTDIRQSVMGGLTYLAKYLYAYQDRSNVDQTRLGLACYNAGPVAVKRAGGVPDNGVTPKYVNKVCDLFVKLHRDGMP